MVGLQTVASLRQRDHARIRLRPRNRQPVGQPPHRRAGHLPQGTAFRSRRHRAHPDRPRLRPGLRHRVRREGGARAVRRRSPASDAPQARCRTGARGSRTARQRKQTMHRKTHFDDVPIKPQRVYEEMNRAFGRDVLLCHRDRAVTDRRRPVPAGVRAAELDQLRSGRTARVDGARRPRCRRRRPQRHRGRAVGRLRLPVPDRGTGGRARSSTCPTSMSW